MIGQIMKNLRLAKGITQVDMAEAIGVKQSTISSWEIERTSPTLKQLCDIANILEVSVDQLVGRSDTFAQDPEAEQAYRRNKLLHEQDYTLAQMIVELDAYTLTREKDREKIAEIFARLSDNEFKELANIFVAVSKTRR